MGNSLNSLNFRSHEQDLMKRYLHDFLVSQRAGPQELDVVRRHWQSLHHHYHQTNDLFDNEDAKLPILALYDTFYGFLFDLSPRFKPLLCDSVGVKEKLLTSVFGALRNVVVEANRRGNCQSSRIQQLALLLFQTGMRCEFFNVFGHVIMLTLQSLAPKLWTSQVEQAWRVVFGQVAVLVLRDLEQLQLMAQQKHEDRVVICVRFGGITHKCSTR